MENIGKIKTDEGGYRSEIYLCSRGKLSWLYGRNIKDRPIRQDEWDLLEAFLKQGFTMKDWADKLFEIEIISLSCTLRNAGVNLTSGEIPKGVCNIILNMSYNMGFSKFNPSKWPKFFKAIKDRNWKQAAIEGRDSKWFHQVGVRSVRLMNSLEKVDIQVKI